MLTNLDNVVYYTVSGNTYPITFPYWAKSDIKAYVTLSDESVEELTQGTDYSLTDPDGVSGTLTKLTAWTDAQKLTIYREVALTQEVDLINGEKIDGEQLEEALDLKAAGLQQMQEQFTRTVKTSIDEVGSDFVIPNTEARKGTGDGTLLGFDGTGKAIVLRDLKQFDADVANTASNASSASTSASNAHTSDLKAEGYAVGTQGGVPVSSGSPYYNNNAKYFKDYVQTTVGDHATALAYLDTSSANVDTVAGIGTQVNTVAGISSNVTTVAGNTSNINTVAGNNSNITTVAGVSSAVSTVAGNTTNINTVAGNNANVSTVASNIAGVNTVASNIAGVLAADDYASLSRQYSEGKKLDGTTVSPSDEGYHNNSKYYLDIVKQTISGALRYQGVWTTTGATDYSGISLPRLKGDMFYCQGSACTIGGVTYSQGDYIIFNQDVSSGTITTAMIDKIDNTETVTPDNLVELTNKTIDANNNTLKNVVTSKNITNCITEILQDINLTLSSGTLTLKAGSKVYVPNGANTFDVVNIDTDKTLTVADNAKQMICVNASNGNLFERRLSNCVSGAGATTNWGFAYNTTTNQIRAFNVSGDDLGTNYSFPIAIVTVSGGAISSIDQVFNGMGYIGSTLFVLPNVKGLLPNGRNSDGTLKSTQINTSKVLTITSASTRTNELYIANANVFEGALGNNYYDETTNFIKRASDGAVIATLPVATYTTTSGVISNFKPKTAFHAVDYNDWANHIGSGKVHTVAAADFGTGFSGTVKWTVVNKVCHVSFWAFGVISGTAVTAINNMPKALFPVSALLCPAASGSPDTFVYCEGTTSLKVTTTATGNRYGSFSYPVADDWVES